MRVLHLHASILYGGVETFLRTLANQRDAHPGMEHTFATCFESRFTDEIRTAGLEPVPLGGARLSRPWSILAARRRLRHLIEAGKPDVAICHLCKPLYLFGPVLRSAGVPIVLYLHAPLEPGVFERLCRSTRPDLMVGVSRHTLRTGRDLLFPDAEGAVIHYPMPWPESRFALEPAHREAIRTDLQTGADDVAIVQATRMNAWKGHRELLEGLGRMRDVPGWVLWMIGGPQNAAEGTYLDGLKGFARELGIAERVRFVGQRSDVPDLLGAADLYCQANTGSEGFSLSFTEAFSAGLPIVTTDIGSAREIVGPEVGLLAPVRDADALAERLTRLVVDAPLRRSMGAAARGWIRGLSDTRQQIELVESTLRRVAKP